jgi:hypothetical protein
MAFPEYALTVTDDFNRADATDLGASWSETPGSGLQNWEIQSNQAFNNSGGYAIAWWDAQDYADFEAVMTVAVAPGGSNSVGFNIRMREHETTWNNQDSYLCHYNGTFNIAIQTNDGYSVLDGSAGTLSNGDKLGVRANGSTIELWHYTGGSWTLVASATDTTYPTGNVGIQGQGTTLRIDDFTIAAIPTYASEVIADAPRVWYRFQEASGLPQDSSVNAVHADVTYGTPTYQAATPLASDPTDYAVTLASASSEAFEVSNDAALDYADVVTYEFWAKRADSDAALQVLMARINGLSVSFLSNKFACGKAAVDWLRWETGTTTDSLWHHYAVTKNGSTVKMYKDGSEISTTFVNDLTLTDTENPLWIGVEISTGYFNGSMDEVAVSASDLSATRIRAHYEAALAAMFPDRFGGPQQLTASAATIYTAAVPVIVDLISVSNPSGAAVDLTLSIGTDAAGTRLFDGLSIPADSQRDLRVHFVLAAAEVIQAFASSASVLDVTLNGRIA